MKKALLAFFVLLWAVVAQAQEPPLSPFDGPQDPASLFYYLNQLVNNINNLFPLSSQLGGTGITALGTGVASALASSTNANGGFATYDAFGLDLYATAFPHSTLTYSLGSANNQWNYGYIKGLAMGPSALQGWIIGSQEQDIRFSSLSDGTNCNEIDMGTPGSSATGVGDIVQRFNLRSECAGQGQSIINVFESMTFPFWTSFPYGDAYSPGIGAAQLTPKAVVTASQTSFVLTVTAVTSGTITPGDYIMDAIGVNGQHISGGNNYVLPYGSSCPSPTTGVGGTGTYCMAYGQTIPSLTINAYPHPHLTLRAGATTGSASETIGWVDTNNPMNVQFDSTLAGGTGQLVLSGLADKTKQLDIGFDTGSNYGYAQATQVGVSYNTLKLNPSGGTITVGAAIPIASLLALPCNSSTVTQQTWVNNGVATPTYHLTVSTTGPATWPVFCTYNGTTYSWVY